MSSREDVAISGEVQVSGNGASFIGALIAAAALPLDDVAYMLSKPWKWQDEYDAWLSCERPTSASDHGWSEFIEALDVDA